MALAKSENTTELGIEDCLKLIDKTFRNPASPWFQQWKSLRDFDWRPDGKNGWRVQFSKWTLRQRFAPRYVAFYVEAHAYKRTWRLTVEQDDISAVAIFPSIEFTRMIAISYFEALLSTVLRIPGEHQPELFLGGFSWREVTSPRTHSRGQR